MNTNQHQKNYEVKLPRIMTIVLSIASYYRKTYFNTNDLAILGNKYKQDIIRTRKDKEHYAFANDTNFGGIRGNLATLLTWKGVIKKDNRLVNAYSVGRNEQIVNAVASGKIMLDLTNDKAHTQNENLLKLLKAEIYLRSVREGQAHIKTFIKNNNHIGFGRDLEFPKTSVVKTSKGVCFLRAIVNNFVDSKNEVLSYRIVDLWSSKKILKANIHVLFVVPRGSDYWCSIYALSLEELWINKPAIININLLNKKCFDDIGKEYELRKLDYAINNFTKRDANINLRIGYDPREFLIRYVIDETKNKRIRESEFSLFTKNFLNWNPRIKINNVEVCNIIESSSGGVDLTLQFVNGSEAKVELEHNWKNYIDHGHHTSNAWSKCWLYADEQWDFDNIKNIFQTHFKKHGDRVPTTFLTKIDGKQKIFRVDWHTLDVSEIDITNY
ncbi:MAG: hypothetical protein COV34_01200 [Candidatus Zambryskibacteria bacterium CG10_big_fil_rev_8_21_14_0_10_42_12]|uniref:Uncharacterized protein n=1 Tax=Candidatus Zambryskibacteria bacterium CG10_big_fil_rev_8_21_14_0_10_42_12 TaxID=1975115 RepID=A0A2H0QVA6_9BACT|nr:MAG: hypothetical protein COV34_01200 [Candidatus Zambryskibacteria bacterium CG10_big_fil_rev_8_21_14_0_10_42_12]